MSDALIIGFGVPERHCPDRDRFRLRPVAHQPPARVIWTVSDQGPLSPIRFLARTCTS